MAQARWNGVDGMDERTRAPYWRIGMRHALADAARGYDWSRVLRVLTEHPDCVNASRPGGRARYAPLHQAAHGGAPASVVRRLLDLGAWRTLRTRGGERPVDIARRRGHSRVIPMLMPAYRRRRVPLDDLRRMQRHFHAVIREHPPGRRPCLRLPEIEPLLEMGRERVYFEVPGMFGGFEYWLEDDGVVPRLHVETFRRIINCDLRYEVTPHGWRLVDEFDRGPEFRPVSNPSTAPRTTAPAGPRSRTRRPPRPAARAGGPPTPGSERVPLPKEEQAKHSASGRVESPALASIRLASGETGYVELSPEGRRRLAVAEGAIVQFSNRDVAERHRDDRGIRWMSLNRLMRLRQEETTGQQERRARRARLRSSIPARERRSEFLRQGLLEPLHAVPVVGRRKVMVAFVLDMHDQPWSWEESEQELEERLRNYDEALYRQHMRDVRSLTSETAERYGDEERSERKT